MPDGRRLLFVTMEQGLERRGLWLQPADGSAAPEPLVVEQGGMLQAGAVSPDDLWVAYLSDESGRNEVYVRPFEGAGARLQVSMDGGTEPCHARGGRPRLARAGQRATAGGAVRVR